MNHSRAVHIGLRKELGNWAQVDKGGPIQRGLWDFVINCCNFLVFYLPSNTAVWLPLYVGRLGELLAKVVPRQFLKEEIVKTLLRYETLNSYDAWLDALDQVEGGGGDGKAVLQLCLHLHAGEVQVEWDASFHRHTWVCLSKVPLVKKVFSVISPPPYSTIYQRLNESGEKKSLSRSEQERDLK